MVVMDFNWTCKNIFSQLQNEIYLINIFLTVAIWDNNYVSLNINTGMVASYKVKNDNKGTFVCGDNTITILSKLQLNSR
jgi:hypothetical protein